MPNLPPIRGNTALYRRFSETSSTCLRRSLPSTFSRRGNRQMTVPGPRASSLWLLVGSLSAEALNDDSVTKRALAFVASNNRQICFANPLAFESISEDGLQFDTSNG